MARKNPCTNAQNNDIIKNIQNNDIIKNILKNDTAQHIPNNKILLTNQECEYCGKTGSTKQNLQRHIANCKVKKSNEISELKNLVLKMHEKISDLEDQKNGAIIYKQIPKTIKAMVWNECIGKENGIGQCYVCQTDIDSKHFEAGHIIAKANGGSNTTDNLRPVCSLCNKSIGKNNMDLFKEQYINQIAQKN